MATISKTPSNTWKAIIRKQGWPSVIKTFRIKRDAQDWARQTEDEMVRGVYINRTSGERHTLKAALTRYRTEVTPTKRQSTQLREKRCASTLEKELGCWRRVKTDHLCRLKIDQAFSGVAYYAAVDKSTRLRWC